MRKLLPIALFAALVSGCSIFSQRPEDHVRVEGAGSGPDETSSMNAARREAVASLLDLYISSEARAARADRIEKRILSRSKEFLARERQLERKRDAGVVSRRLELWVNVSTLGRALEAEGLLRPDGVRGKPWIAVTMRPPTAAKAAAALLSEHGYRADPSADAAKADAVLSGSAAVSVVDDPRLGGMFGAKAKLDGAVKTAGGAAFPIEAEAEAFDVTTEGAAERALENAAGFAAEAARRKLGERYVERLELALIVENLGGLGQIRRLIETLRKQPEIAEVSLGAVLGKDVKLRIFAERLTADELAARLLRMEPYALLIKAVDTDAGIVETVESGIAPGGEGDKS